MKKVAIICNYPLQIDRIGGMDRFFWLFDKKGKENNLQMDWYFSDFANYEGYSTMNIISANNEIPESFFLQKIKSENLKYDFVITHFIELCTPFFKEIKQFYPAKIICIDHNPRPLEGFPTLKIIKNAIKGILYSKYIDQFVGVSNYTKKHILKDYGFFLKSKTKVIHNGIDVSVFIKREILNKNKFIVTSHLRHSKGIQDILKALNLLDPVLRNEIVIDIYGDGPYKNELKNLCETYNLNKIVNFKGNSSELNILYSKYSYLIQPSYGETFCYSVIESLICNVPVITTFEAGNVLSIIEHNKNGFLFNAGNAEQLSIILKNCIKNQLILNPEINIKIHNQFSLQKMVENHLKLLQ